MRAVTKTAFAVCAMTLCAFKGPVVSPARPVTDPSSIVSIAGPAVGPSAEDIVASRSASDLAWSRDGTQLYVISNLAGRNNIWRTERDGGWPQPITRAEEGQSFLQLSPNGKVLFYAQDRGGDEMHDIYLVSTEGGSPRNLTETPDVSEKAALPSPDGRRLAFTYKPRGQSQRDVAIMDLATREVRNITNDTDPNGVWTAVAWAADGFTLLLNREQTLLGGDSAVFTYSRSSGALRAVTRPQKGLRELAAGYVRDGASIAVTSNRGSSQTRAGVLDVRTREYTWFAPTPWEQRVSAVSPDGNWVAITLNEAGNESLSVINAATLQVQRLETPGGLSAVVGSNPFSPDGRWLAFSHSAGDSPPDLRIYDLQKEKTKVVASFALPTVSQGGLPPSRIVTYRSFDGTLVSGVLTVPFNLRRDGSNPGIVLPHGGPTNATKDGFSRKAAYLASRGYVVLQPNFRGSTGYGKAFQDAEIMDMGGGDIADVVSAKSFLVATGFVDSKRVGITGNSGGGWLTMLALGKFPGTFAAGVQVYGIIDWFSFMERTDPLIGIYLRRLLGDPVKNASSYRKASPATYLAGINVPLLSIQGDRDTRVPMDQAIQVREALNKRGVTTELIIYEDEGHSFQQSKHQVNEMVKTVEWFDRYMPRGPSSDTATSALRN